MLLLVFHGVQRSYTHTFIYVVRSSVNLKEFRVLIVYLTVLLEFILQHQHLVSLVVYNIVRMKFHGSEFNSYVCACLCVKVCDCWIINITDNTDIWEEYVIVRIHLAFPVLEKLCCALLIMGSYHLWKHRESYSTPILQPSGSQSMFCGLKVVMNSSSFTCTFYIKDLKNALVKKPFIFDK